MKVNILVAFFNWQEKWNFAFCTKQIVILLKYRIDILLWDMLHALHVFFLLLCLAVFIIFIRFHFISPQWLLCYLKMCSSIFPLSQVIPSEWLISLGTVTRSWSLLFLFKFTWRLYFPVGQQFKNSLFVKMPRQSVVFLYPLSSPVLSGKVPVGNPLLHYWCW